MFASTFSLPAEIARFEGLVSLLHDTKATPAHGWKAAIMAAARLLDFTAESGPQPSRHAAEGQEMHELHQRGYSIFERVLREAVTALPAEVAHFSLQTGSAPTMGYRSGPFRIGADSGAHRDFATGGAFIRLRRGTPEEVSRWVFIAC